MTDHCRSRSSLTRLKAALAITVPVLLAGFTAPASAAVMISQVYGGGGNGSAPYLNDFVELHNNGASDVNLTGWSVQYSSATGTSWANQLVVLSGSIPAGRYYLVQLGSGGAVGAALPTANASANFNMSATAGKLALVNNATPLSAVTCPLGGATVVDFVGYGTTANCAEPSAGSAAAPAPSATVAIVRASVGNSCLDTNVNSTNFATAAPVPRNTSAAAQSCSGTADPGGGGTPTDAAIFTIQGSGSTSPLVNRVVKTSGVITKVNNNGFFMQDQIGDGNPATSDGIFVFTGSTAYPAAVVGNMVQVTGTVVEFNTGAATNADTLAHTVTELSPVTAVTFVNSGFVIAPVDVTMPEIAAGGLERYEGMLVRLTGTFTVQQNFFLGRYGQLTLAVGGRLETPTNRFRPGAQATALADENARRRILLDDGSSLQNPAPTPYIFANGLPRAGDTTGAITGVLDYGLATSSNTDFGDYKIHPTATPAFTIANPRTPAPEAVGGNIKVASFNVLNYFTTFTNGNTASGQTGQGCTLGASTTAGNCRGADNLVEFQRQQTKIVEAMAAINADVLGLMEIQNNGNVAAQNLVDALNAKVGANTYVTTALPTGGTGTDAIRVAMIYKPTKLSPLGTAVSDSDPVNNRPTLAQTFTLSNGEKFTLFVNHLKSKGSCPGANDADYAGNFDSGDGQGCWNLQRKQQAERLRTFIAQRQTASGSSDVLLIGDFNAYAQEDPIFVLTGNGFVDQIGRFNNLGYSYVFNGSSGRLDHAIASGTMSSRVNRAVHWHINADETSLADYNTEFKSPATTCNNALCAADPYTPTPYRSSDHDPVVVGLNLYKTFTGTTGRDTLVGTAGDDVFVGGAGVDVMTGGGGTNVYVYQSMRDAGDTITDFVPGKDRIDLTALLASLGLASGTAGNAYSLGVVVLAASGSDTLLMIDTDGSAGPVLARSIATLKNVSPNQFVAARDLGVQ